MNDLKEHLSTAEGERFHQLEVVIEEGQQTFVEVGMAISEIKINKLYRENYARFEDYCKKRWGWTERHASRIAEASVIVRSLPPAAAAQVKTIAAANALKDVPPANRPAVVAKAAQTGPAGPNSPNTPVKGGISAARVRSSSPPPKSPPPVQDVQLDRTGIPIPPGILELWNRADEEAGEMICHISTVRAALRKRQDDPAFCEINFSSVLSSLNQVFADVKVGSPHAVCPTCQGKDTNECKICNGRGFISEFRYNICIPAEVKQLRAKK